MKQNQKLNVFTLSGLIVGPILGSGLILLPPLLYNSIGDFSLFIWGAILLLGFAFALIFGKLAILFPGEGGVSLATKEAMGKKYQLLTSFYLICAVFFGPVAVLLIAAGFIQEFFPDRSLVELAFYIFCLTYTLLLIKIDFLGKLMLVVSSAISLIFVISSVNILIHVDDFHFTIPNITINEIGYSFLLAFWAIVGWEVIGNYSGDTKDKKTLMNGVILSALLVSVVYFLVTLAIIFGDFNSSEEFKLLYLIEPVFGKFSSILLTVVSVTLCVGTLILFIGGVARLIASLKLTKFTSKHLKNKAPIGALNFLTVIYIFVLILVSMDLLLLDNLVAYAVATLKTTKKTKIPEDIKTNYLKRNATSLTIDI